MAKVSDSVCVLAIDLNHLAGKIAIDGI